MEGHAPKDLKTFHQAPPLEGSTTFHQHGAGDQSLIYNPLGTFQIQRIAMHVVSASHLTMEKTLADEFPFSFCGEYSPFSVLPPLTPLIRALQLSTLGEAHSTPSFLGASDDCRCRLAGPVGV